MKSVKFTTQRDFFNVDFLKSHTAIGVFGFRRTQEKCHDTQWEAIKLYFFPPLPNKLACVTKQKGNRCTLKM